MIAYCSSGNLYEANLNQAEELRAEAERLDEACEYDRAEEVRQEAEVYEAAAKALLERDEI